MILRCAQKDNEEGDAACKTVFLTATKDLSGPTLAFFGPPSATSWLPSPNRADSGIWHTGLKDDVRVGGEIAGSDNRSCALRQLLELEVGNQLDRERLN